MPVIRHLTTSHPFTSEIFKYFSNDSETPIFCCSSAGLLPLVLSQDTEYLRNNLSILLNELIEKGTTERILLKFF